MKSKKANGWLLLVAISMICPGNSKLGAQVDNPVESQTSQVTKKYIYKSTAQGDLEIILHLPSGWSERDKRPAIVFFFGGGWQKGSVNQFSQQAAYLSARGLVAARADYRVKNRQGTLADKCVEDAKSAVRWLKANAGRLGIDTTRIAASGGSAGGHIAACTFSVNGYEAVNEDRHFSSRPALLILFNPVLDATALKRVERMGSLSIATDLSPNLHLTKNTPPTLLFYGSDDPLLAQGKIYLKKAAELGFEAVLYTAGGVGHGFFNHEPWMSKTLFILDQFLTEYGYLRGSPTIPDQHDVTMMRFDKEEKKYR